MATEPNPQSQGPPPPPEGHQVHDPSAKWIFGIVGGLFLVGLCLQFILAGMLHALQNRPPPTDRWQPASRAARLPAPPPPYPRLQISPPDDLRAFHAHEDAELNSYAWLVRTAGVVRIPITRAMELVLREGLPVRSGTNQNQLGPSSYQLIKQRPQERDSEGR